MVAPATCFCGRVVFVFQDLFCLIYWLVSLIYARENIISQGLETEWGNQSQKLKNSFIQTLRIIGKNWTHLVSPPGSWCHSLLCHKRATCLVLSVPHALKSVCQVNVFSSGQRHNQFILQHRQQTPSMTFLFVEHDLGKQPISPEASLNVDRWDCLFMDEVYFVPGWSNKSKGIGLELPPFGSSETKAEIRLVPPTTGNKFELCFSFSGGAMHEEKKNCHGMERRGVQVLRTQPPCICCTNPHTCAPERDFSFTHTRLCVAANLCQRASAERGRNSPTGTWVGIFATTIIHAGGRQTDRQTHTHTHRHTHTHTQHGPQRISSNHFRPAQREVFKIWTFRKVCLFTAVGLVERTTGNLPLGICVIGAKSTCLSGQQELQQELFRSSFGVLCPKVKPWTSTVWNIVLWRSFSWAENISLDNTRTRIPKHSVHIFSRTRMINWAKTDKVFLWGLFTKCGIIFAHRIHRGKRIILPQN